MGPSKEDFNFGVVWVPATVTAACALLLLVKALRVKRRTLRLCLGGLVLMLYAALRATAEGFVAQRKGNFQEKRGLVENVLGLDCSQEEFVFNLLASEFSMWYYMCFLPIISAKFRRSTWKANGYVGFMIFIKLIVLLALLFSKQPSKACVFIYSLLGLAIIHYSHKYFAVHAWSPRLELPIRVTLILAMTYSMATYIIAFQQAAHIVTAAFMDPRAVLCDTAATGTLLSLAFRDSLEIAFVFVPGTILWTQSWAKADKKSGQER